MSFISISTDSSASLSAIPELPIEIYGRIIDCLAEGRYAEQRDVDLSSLRACAIVCSSFLPLCRQHIFYRLDNLFFSYWHSTPTNPGGTLFTNKRFMSLVRVLKNNPSLACMVRELHIHLRYQIDSAISKPILADLEECADTVGQFSNLIELSIREPNRGAANFVTAWTKLRSHTLQTYFNQKTLQTFYMDAPQLPEISGVFESPQLTNLTLAVDPSRPSPFPSVSFAVSHLTQLRVLGVSQFPLSALRFLPSLNLLLLRGVKHVITGDLNSRHPSFSLQNLKLAFTDDGPLSSLIQFYITEAKLASVKPFESLTILSINIGTEDEVPIVRNLLQHVCNLQNLDINGQTTPFQLTSLKLDECIKHVFPNLVSLRLSLYAEPHNDMYDTLVSDVLTLFTAIGNGPNAHLEYLYIVIVSNQASHDTVRFPSIVPWMRLASVLASTAGYSSLRRVEVGVKISGKLAEEDEELSIKHMQAFRIGTLGDLYARLGDDLVASYSVHEQY